MAVEVRTVDPADEDALRAFWEVGAACSAHDHVDDGWAPWPVSRRAWTTTDPVRRHPKLAAYDGPDVVGIALVQLDDQDNTHLVFGQPMVLPERRRRGVGTALVTAVDELARAEGRTTLLADVYTPVGAEDHPALRFARRHGYAVAGLEEIKVADLPATEDRWPALAARAAERSDGYTLVSWTEHAPEEHLAEIARLFTRFLGEVPLGDLDLEPQRWSPERIRETEDRLLAIGKRQVLVAAVAPDGTLAGYTNLYVTDGRPERAGIDSTLVLPEHRGHRLGLALKVRLHQETRAHHPEVRRIATSNAGVNSWMNAVNDELGYEVVEVCHELQKRL